MKVIDWHSVPSTLFLYSLPASRCSSSCVPRIPTPSRWPARRPLELSRYLSTHYSVMASSVIMHKKPSNPKLFAVYFRPTFRLLRVSWLKTRCCCSPVAHWRMTLLWHHVASLSTVPWRWLEGFLEVCMNPWWLLIVFFIKAMWFELL